MLPTAGIKQFKFNHLWHSPLFLVTNSKDRLHLSWDKFEAIDNGYPKFLLKSSYEGNCIKKTVLGEFTCLSGTIKLVRRVSYYVIRVYAPTFLSVIAAFIGFWIPILGWPARVIQFIKVLYQMMYRYSKTIQVTILVTPLLNLITQDIGLNNDINVSYVVAIHWWMMCCQFFVFMALVEYATAISWAHFINEKKALRAAVQVIHFVYSLLKFILCLFF